MGVTGGNIHTILLQEENIINVPPTIGFEQWFDMSDWKKKKAEGDQAYNEWFKAKMDDVIRRLRDPEHVEKYGQITELRKKLNVQYAVGRQQKLLNEHYTGRKWLGEKIDAWLEDPNAPRRCLVTGVPGVGKSAFAVHYAHYNPKTAAALFFSADMPNYNDPCVVIQTLAYLLACRLSAYRKSLLWELNQEDRTTLAKLTEKELLDKLITRPLSQAINGNHPAMCIILDGLEECGDPQKNTLAKTIARYADSLPWWLHILIVARDVPAVKNYTKNEQLCLFVVVQIHLAGDFMPVLRFLGRQRIGELFHILQCVFDAPFGHVVGEEIVINIVVVFIGPGHAQQHITIFLRIVAGPAGPETCNLHHHMDSVIADVAFVAGIAGVIIDRMDHCGISVDLFKSDLPLVVALFTVKCHHGIESALHPDPCSVFFCFIQDVEAELQQAESDLGRGCCQEHGEAVTLGVIISGAAVFFAGESLRADIKAFIRTVVCTPQLEKIETDALLSGNIALDLDIAFLPTRTPCGAVPHTQLLGAVRCRLFEDFCTMGLQLIALHIARSNNAHDFFKLQAFAGSQLYLETVKYGPLAPHRLAADGALRAPGQGGKAHGKARHAERILDRLALQIQRRAGLHRVYVPELFAVVGVGVPDIGVQTCFHRDRRGAVQRLYRVFHAGDLTDVDILLSCHQQRFCLISCYMR